VQLIRICPGPKLTTRTDWGWARGRGISRSGGSSQKRTAPCPTSPALAAGGTEATARLRELADPHVELPGEDPPAQVQGLYRRALELVRGEFEERTWQMFWQSVVEDRDAAAVAEQFGVSTAAVRKARSRVLRRLKQEVGDAIE
jgi:DNA-directed RNA polymerase specialized sigma24 family protein